MNQTTAARFPRSTAIQNAGQFMEWLMAIGEVERELIAAEPRLRREIWFQMVALTLCPVCLGYAIFDVAIHLLGYTMLGALVLAAVAAFCAFAIDKHYLIQGRGDASERTQKEVRKVRFVSALIIGLSFVLMAADTFHDDIARVLAGAQEARRAQLEQSPQYKLDIDGARDGVARAEQAASRADELRTRLAQVQVEQARAWEEYKNELEGNTTGNRARVKGGGEKARGFEAAANRLGQEVDVARQELAQLGNVGERLTAAKQRLATVDARLDAEAGLSVSGPSRKLEALVNLLCTSPSAWIVMFFWFLIGIIPDLLMFKAQSQMFNHELFVSMRFVQNEDQQARIADLRGKLRQKRGDRLAPMEVRLASVALSKSESKFDSRQRKQDDQLGEFA